MPERAMWEGFFEPSKVLARLHFGPCGDDVADFGCGYGTFSIAAAQLTKGLVHAIDIDEQMTEATAAAAAKLALANVRTVLRDFVAQGSGLPSESVGYAMLFNVLHAEDAVGLLREAHRVLARQGRAAIMHWIYDAATPRGPDLSIRPRPEQLIAFVHEAGLLPQGPVVALPPYHYGLVAMRP
jgi:SAM-dependent methyltransferase